MSHDAAFDAMADICILAGQAVMTAGSDELRAAMRVVLAVLGHEIADRTPPQRIESASARGHATKSGRSGPSRTVRRVRFVPCS